MKILSAILCTMLMLVSVPVYASQLLTLPLFATWDSNGDPLAGGYLFSYESETTTALTLYTDKALSTPATDACDGSKAYLPANAFCVALDSRGESGPLYFLGLATVTLKTSAGTTIWSVDGVSGQGSSVITYSSLDDDYGCDLAYLKSGVYSDGKKDIRVDCSPTMASATILSADVHLIFGFGGIIDTAGFQLTFNAPFQADRIPILTGDGAIVFVPGSVDVVYPEWWAGEDPVQCDTDMTSSLQAAINAAASAGATVDMSPGCYYMSDSLYLYYDITENPNFPENVNAMDVVLQGQGSSLERGASGSYGATTLLYDGTDPAIIIDNPYSEPLWSTPTLRGFTVYASDCEGSIVTISDWASTVTLEDVAILADQGAATGLDVGTVEGLVLNDVTLIGESTVSGARSFMGLDLREVGAVHASNMYVAGWETGIDILNTAAYSSTTIRDSEISYCDLGVDVFDNIGATVTSNLFRFNDNDVSDAASSTNITNNVMLDTIDTSITITTDATGSNVTGNHIILDDTEAAAIGVDITTVEEAHNVSYNVFSAQNAGHKCILFGISDLHKVAMIGNTFDMIAGAEAIDFATVTESEDYPRIYNLSTDAQFLSHVDLSFSMPAAYITAAATIDVTGYSAAMITGTDEISAITGGTEGKILTLIGAGTVAGAKLMDAGEIKLAGGLNFTFGSEDTIMLIRVVDTWCEVSRSNN